MPETSPLGVAVLMPHKSHEQFVKSLLSPHGLHARSVAGIVDIVRVLRNGDVAAVVLEDTGVELHDWLATIERHAPGAAPVLVVGPGAGAGLADILARGATDYVDFPEMRAQLAARLRARIGNRKQTALHMPGAGDYELSEDTCTLNGPGIEISLTRREFALAQILFARVGTVVGTRALHHHLWGPSRSIGARMLEEHVSNLRRKLQRHCVKVCIRAVTGTGYRLDIESV